MLERLDLRAEDEAAGLEDGREALLELGTSGAYCAFDVDERDRLRHAGECSSGEVAFLFVRPAEDSSATSPLRRLTIPPAERGSAGDDRGRDDVFDVAERVVEVLPASPAAYPAPGEREAPDRRAEERQDRVADERRLEDARRDRDERADDRRQPPEEDRPVLPALEPALGRSSFSSSRWSQRPCRSRYGPAAVEADRPADHRPERVADRPGERDRDVAPGSPSSIVRPNSVDVLVRERPGGERAAVDHHELARGRKHGVDEHEQEDRVEAVVADDRGDASVISLRTEATSTAADCTAAALAAARPAPGRSDPQDGCA